MNLLTETETDLKWNNKTWNDVEFITDGKYEIDIDNFKDVARKTDYYEGFGHVYIPMNLKIVGKDWWLERYEYDGQECWVFKTKTEKPKEKRFLLGLTDDRFTEECIFEND